MQAPVFLQTDSAASQTERRQKAVSVLRRAATLSGSPQVALLAASAQLDAFTKVKALIDKMVAELTTQQKDEVDKRDWCIEELNINKRDTTAAYDKKESLLTQIADLEKNIEKLNTNKRDTTAAYDK